MPERKTIKKAQKAKREGKAPTTQASAFVEEEMEHIREGKHGAKNTKQAIAIGLSKARKAGVDLPPPPGRKESQSESKHKGRITQRKSDPQRSKAGIRRLKKESKESASQEAISLQARRAAKKRSSADKHQAAMKAVRTKGKGGLRKAGKKAAQTQEENKKAA